MKRASIIVMVLLMIQSVSFATRGGAVECTPENVAEWMVQRQVGRNKLEAFFVGDTYIIVEFLTTIQDVKREFEDMPVPDCPETEALYDLTIYLYSTALDAVTQQLIASFADIDTSETVSMIWGRLDYYGDNIDQYYNPLEEIAGIDVMAAANEIYAVPEPAGPPTIEVSEDGIITAQGSGAYVFDPIDIPTGVYRLTFEASDYAGVDIEELTGDCSNTILTVGIDGGQNQEVFRSTDCRGLIEIQYAGDDDEWVLTLEPLE